MKKIVKIVLAILVVAGLVIAGVKAVKKARAKDKAQPIAKIYPIVAPTFTPKVEEVTLTLPYLAEVSNDKDVQLSSRIAARVITILPSGSKVKKGDVVIKLDTTNIQGALQSVKNQITAAKVNLRNLRQTHKRTQELLKIQGASIEESQKELTMIANAKATLNALRQKEIELQNNLSYATILSPVDGVVAKTFVNKGALSAPAHPLVSISAKNGFYLMVRVPTTLPVKGVQLEGKSYQATALGSTLHGLAEYKVYTNDKKLISGDRVEVSVIVLDQKACKLPFDAILNRDGKSYVLLVKENKATPKEIHILQSGEEGVVTKENLEGSKIVLAKPDILLKLISGYALSIKEK